MVAIRIQDQQRGTGSRRPRRQNGQAPGERITGQYWRLARQRRAIVNVLVCFRDQPAMLPLQIDASLERLCSLRRAAQAARRYLSTLYPQPQGCMAQLSELEFRSSQALLTLAMFAPICQSVSYARVDLHLTLRYLLPGVVVSLDNTTSQLAALLDRERESGQGQEERATL
jgi:hypothetical protein